MGWKKNDNKDEKKVKKSIRYISSINNPELFMSI